MNFSKTLLLSTAIVSASSFAVAAEGGPAGQTLDMSRIPGGQYNLDKSHASIVFGISHLGFSEYKGFFEEFDATLNLGEDNLENSKVSVTIDADEIYTNNDHLEEKLQGEAYFNTAMYPEITFESTALNMEDEDSGILTDNLTMLGVTKPVELDVTFKGGALGPFSNKYTLGFSAEGTINRTEFGMTELVPMVADEVHLDIEAEFVKNGEAVQ